MREMSIYIYCWSYDKAIHKPVKEEFEIHNFASDMPLDELVEQAWIIKAMADIEQRHLQRHPEADRYPHAKIGFDNIRPSLKPKSRQITLEQYTLLTHWQTKYGKKFRRYQKVNESKRSINV